MQLADCEAMLVTQSEHGMTLVPRSGEAIHVPAHPVKVRDVSGAGDTVAAALAVALAAGADWETALRMANAAAAVAVGKKGTAIVTPAELRRKILPHASLAAEEKIVAAGGDLDAHLAEWRRQGLRVGFTNGCFDILHPGHVKVLTAARGACDRLIVGLNSDASVKRLKGEGRPVQDERARAEVLAALEAVDLVVDLRGGHADRADHADQAERAGQGRRLHPRAGGRPRDRRGRWRRGAAGRCPAGLQHDVAGRSRAREARRERGRGSAGRSAGAGGRGAIRRAWVDDRRCLRGPDRGCRCPGRRRWSRSSRSSLLVSMVPFLDVRAFLQSLKRPICCAADRAVCCWRLVGTLWSDAPWGDAALCGRSDRRSC